MSTSKEKMEESIDEIVKYSIGLENAIDAAVKYGYKWKNVGIENYSINGNNIIITDKFGNRYETDWLRIILDENFISSFCQYLIENKPDYINTQSFHKVDEENLKIDLILSIYNKNFFKFLYDLTF